ncbi:MAG: tyrosine-type recombinase/integrase [Bacteroidales bacterium]
MCRSDPNGGLQALTFIRPFELRYGQWDEIDWGSAIWRIPAERMKMKKNIHLVPLSKQAIITLEELRTYTGHSKYMFIVRPERPICENAELQALHRMGYAKGEITVHGFRSTASTTLYEHGFPGDVIELQLAHSENNSVKAAYNYAEHLELRRNMMQWYADYLYALKDGLEPPEK